MNRLVVFQYLVGVEPREVVFGSIPKQFIDDPHFLIDLDDVLRALEFGYLNVDVALDYELAVVIDLEELEVQVVENIPQHNYRYRYGNQYRYQDGSQ